MADQIIDARYGSPAKAEEILTSNCSEELLRAALINVLERVGRLERRMLGKDQ